MKEIYRSCRWNVRIIWRCNVETYENNTRLMQKESWSINTRQQFHCVHRISWSADEQIQIMLTNNKYSTNIIQEVSKSNLDRRKWWNMSGRRQPKPPTKNFDNPTKHKRVTGCEIQGFLGAKAAVTSTNKTIYNDHSQTLWFARIWSLPATHWIYISWISS